MGQDQPQFSAVMLHPRYWLLWLALGVCWLIARMPYPWLMALGRGVGALFQAFAKERKRIAAINLQMCFPALSEAERSQLLRRNMREMGVGFIELLMAWFRPRARLENLLTVEGLEHIQALGEQGAIVVTRHTCSVQLSVILATMYHPFAGMYRRHKNPVLEYVQRRARQRMDPCRVVAFERKEVRTMLRFLRQGAKVLYAPDQDYGIKQGVWARFFGVPAATVTATSRFAKLGRAKVLVMDFERLPEGRGYRLVFEAPLADFPSDDETADVQRLNDIFEAQVRRAPETYLWVHRRFKTRPAGEPKPYGKKRKRRR
ncbi:LpxL/LpxP family Kdo(2)-lipid IV(A) lauroyl/palmitoleoyl acyltransferase [Simiduia sp. 21SJ11W-1]|uniref:LpxL/LpxP family Kdo(2)-lipid IV(A) lauroyl/palmitoleoyl acyltransferase n=1 Tax=Simiduia sp. 21SJ11W-1 TaxID=2909669 RepID=UPI0020A22378|nr:LpxL/LpxP family Kdo(2)-lipid IV(A) lauroyl/palmitoleoyl acyltransferase [Simiduia sp. 21SJ11W-1]UTA46737.1 LpxL/LpxP family Kdo(2)-lipid IV(A) lauroyl/palmitoleoyl acyltransferase [Simiduia sp. 21SJ11W-1]